MEGPSLGADSYLILGGSDAAAFAEEYRPQGYGDRTPQHPPWVSGHEALRGEGDVEALENPYPACDQQQNSGG